MYVHNYGLVIVDGKILTVQEISLYTLVLYFFTLMFVRRNFCTFVPINIDLLLPAITQVLTPPTNNSV